MCINNNKGYVAIIFCFIMPVIIAILGICIDGSMIFYYQARLMTATKYAAISATTSNTKEDGNLIIIKDESFVERALEKNFDLAQIEGFIIDSTQKNKCTLNTKAEIKLFFIPLIMENYKTITIHESYTAQRKF